MTLTLHVDGDRWRAHLRAVQAAQPDLVPVAKGNGYGLGLSRLARRGDWLGVDTLAVGTYAEVAAVTPRFSGDVLVLTPWPGETAAAGDPALDHGHDRRVVHTVGGLTALEDLLERSPDARVVLERATSMRRHGFSATGLRAAAELVAAHPRARLAGWAVHLPLATGDHLTEMSGLMADVVAAGGDRAPVVWTSHLTDTELDRLRTSYPDFRFRPRIGTRLWLGDREALRVRARVLETHPLRRGERYGYRQRRSPIDGTLLVVAGGTAHGIGLEAPTGDGSVRARAAALARGGLDAAGLVRSPYLSDGQRLYFAEPPHMQASMLLLPGGARVPAIGEELPVQVRFTTTAVDRTEIS